MAHGCLPLCWLPSTVSSVEVEPTVRGSNRPVTTQNRGILPLAKRFGVGLGQTVPQSAGLRTI